MKIKTIILLFLITIASCQKDTEQSAQPDVCRYVDQMIGINAGRTIVSAGCPFGMVTPVPHFVNFRSHGQKLDSIIGFSHIHASGTGCGDEWGSIYMMPSSKQQDNIKVKAKISDFVSRPGYYKAHMDGHDIDVTLTSTPRTAIHQYKFKSAGKKHILFDISRHLNDKYDTSYIKITSPCSLEGFLSEGAFCSSTTELHKIYFFLKLDRNSTEQGVFSDQKKLQQHEIRNKNIGAWFAFDLPKASVVEARLGISFVSIENAKENMERETKGRSFAGIRHDAHKKWNNMLSRIIVEGSTEDDKKMFYTGLYHMLQHPNVFSDVNGEYLSYAHYPAKGKREVKKAKGYTRYTLFSLWDTYRTVHPFFSLVYPEYQLDMVKSMLGMYNEKGWLPKWEHHGVETYNMNGAPASIVITDTYLKGIKNFDTNLAYEAIKKESTFPDSTSKERNRPGIEQYIKYGGWIPQDFVMISPPVWGPISTTLEYNLADWNFAQFCKATGKKTDYNTFIKRSTGYKNFFHPELQLMAPKDKNGSWYEPYDPNKFTMFCESCPFVEGDAWNYSFFVPHDPKGLIELFSSKEKFVEQLQKCFDDGHFHIGNEPAINFPYLFNFVEGEAWRTQKTVRQEIRKNFNTTIKGLPGEEDAGTISGWLVYSMMGFYPFCPGDADYQLTSPVFDKITIKLNNDYYPGNKFVIKTLNSGQYIQSIRWNGKHHNDYHLAHDEIVKGGELVFKLMDK